VSRRHARILCAEIAACALAFLATCSSEGALADEDFGLGARLHCRLERVRAIINPVLKNIPEPEDVIASASHNTVSIADESADILVTYQDTDSNGRVDCIRLLNVTYEFSGHAPAGKPMEEKLGRRFSAQGYEQALQAFRAEFPSVRTLGGITLGSTFKEIQAAYGRNHFTHRLEGEKRCVAYRAGGVYLIFVLLRDRVVQLVLVETADPGRLFDRL